MSVDLHDLVPYLDRLEDLDESQLVEVSQLIKAIGKLDKRDKAQNDFMSFVRQIWPQFIEGSHHRKIAHQFNNLVNGNEKRLIINLPPRHTKSEFASYLLPAWFLGRHPDRKVIQASNTGDLAVGFGRKVRDLIDSDEYQKLFPGVSLKADTKAAGRWMTNHGGEYFAVGVGGAVAGRGADLFIIDDPHTDQEGAFGDIETFKKTYEWFTTGPRQRLQPGGRIAVVCTRWHKADLVGQVLKKSVQEKNADEWNLITFPAILPSGNSLWPEFWPVEELEKVRDEIPAAKWAAQYLQEPTAAGSALLKRDWWQTWTESEPPKCDFILQSWDTAFTAKEKSDYSACTTWGVFHREGPSGKPMSNIILLDAFKDRLEFPELKEEAYIQYSRWQPDCLIVEGKAAGLPLIHEMRQRGIPVEEYSPFRGNDKVARVNSITDIMASGMVWAPERRFADEVMEECADFPVGENDDYVDSTVQALIRFRQGGFVSLHSDYDDEDDFEPVVANYY